MITICGFFSVEDGWEPLCRLLDKPIPDEPFPRANDAAAVESFFKSMVLKRFFEMGSRVYSGIWLAFNRALIPIIHRIQSRVPVNTLQTP